jgi:hypothetical protein
VSRLRVFALAFLVATVALGTTRAVAAAKPNPRAELLTVAELPAGWSATAAGKSNAAGCGALTTPLARHSIATAQGAYDKSLVPLAEEYIAVYASPVEAKVSYAALSTQLNGCAGFKSPGGTAKIARLSFPHYGPSSAAWRLSETEGAFHIEEDLVLALTGSQVVAVGYADNGTPNLPAAEAVIKTAIAKVNA